MKYIDKNSYENWEEEYKNNSVYKLLMKFSLEKISSDHMANNNQDTVVRFLIMPIVEDVVGWYYANMHCERKVPNSRVSSRSIDWLNASEKRTRGEVAMFNTRHRVCEFIYRRLEKKLKN